MNLTSETIENSSSGISAQSIVDNFFSSDKASTECQDILRSSIFPRVTTVVLIFMSSMVFKEDDVTLLSSMPQVLPPQL